MRYHARDQSKTILIKILSRIYMITNFKTLLKVTNQDLYKQECTPFYCMEEATFKRLQFYVNT